MIVKALTLVKLERNDETIRIETVDGSWIEISGDSSLRYHASDDKQSICTMSEHIRNI